MLTSTHSPLSGDTLGAQIMLSNALPSQLHQLCSDLHCVVSNRGPPASTRGVYDDDKENRSASGACVKEVFNASCC
eukprot:824169-Prorocentrum_minimum.AAC.4